VNKQLELRRFNPQTSKFPLRYGRSPIHSVGLFSDGPIPRGKKVIEYTGERLTIAQADARFRRNWVPGGKRPLYMLRISGRWVLDGAFDGSGAERINHSCDPNLKPFKTRGHMWFVSRRGIQPGEELTLDYQVSPNAPLVRCRCRSTHCRGTINVKKRRLPSARGRTSVP
jgi:SET domain-containing protein